MDDKVKFGKLQGTDLQDAAHTAAEKHKNTLVETALLGRPRTNTWLRQCMLEEEAKSLRAARIMEQVCT